MAVYYVQEPDGLFLTYVRFSDTGKTGLEFDTEPQVFRSRKEAEVAAEKSISGCTIITGATYHTVCCALAAMTAIEEREFWSNEVKRYENGEFKFIK